MSVPQSTIYVCSGVKLNNRYEHSIYWASKSEQLTYFMGKVARTYADYTFLRKSSSIKVQASLEEACAWNYLFFTNDTTNYWYYFITNVEYVNDNTVELTIELDVLQTYARDYTLLRSFVERQHVTDDTVGKHLVDENLELGEIQTLASNDGETVDLGELSTLIMTTVSPNPVNEKYVKVYGTAYNGIFSGARVYAIDVGQFSTDQADELARAIDEMDAAGGGEAIYAIWMYPKKLLGINEEMDGTFKPVALADHFTVTTERPTVLSGGYEPRNKKLLTHPFSFLYLTNNSGGACTFPYEYFGDPTDIRFLVRGVVSPEAVVRMFPFNFKGEAHAYEHGLSLSGFPTCSWTNDTYKLWLAQNQAQQNVTLGSSVVSIVAGIGTIVATQGTGAAVGAGMIAGGVGGIANLMAQRHDAEVQPPQSKGSASSAMNYVSGFQSFSLKRKSISNEMAKIIDGFFDVYGYRLNSVQVPNIHARENWTYVKTVGCHISGSFPVADMTKIEEIFDKGVTFWVNGDKIGNYSLSNNPL